MQPFHRETPGLVIVARDIETAQRGREHQGDEVSGGERGGDRHGGHHGLERQRRFDAFRRRQDVGGNVDAVREAAAQGFDPMIGVLHEIAHGRESLACDMTEPLRALVDRFVVELFRGGHLRADSFSRKGPACLLGKAARKTYFTRWEEEAAPMARRLLVRGLRDLSKVVRASGAAPALPPPGQRLSTGDAPP